MYKMNFKNNVPYFKLINDNMINKLNIISKKFDMDVNEILYRLLLQLPKYSYNELNKNYLIEMEINNIVSNLHNFKETINKYSVMKKIKNLDILEFNIIPNDIADHIFTNLHYLGYPRSNSVNLGLFSYEDNVRKIISLASLSPFDLNHLYNFIPNSIHPHQVMVLSRVYSFREAPLNIISYMLSNIVKWLKQNNQHIKFLITYLNPNLGFSGTSYKASNWFLFAKEIDIKYTYLDGKYITLRNLSNKYNNTNMIDLKKRFNTRLTFSKIQLMPLEIYAFSIAKKIKTDMKYPILIKKVPSLT